MKILLTGYKGFIGQNMLTYLTENTDWEIDNYEWGEEYCGVMGYDWVIHLGANSHTTEKNIDKILTQNTDFSIQLYNDCKRFGVNLQYASSASLYGQNTVFSEDSPLDPITPYAWSKYLFERHTKDHVGGNIVQGFRYFNVYGDHEDHKLTQASPINQFTRQAKTDKIITLFLNSESYFRDFICVKDVCRIHVEFIKSVTETGIWNVGTGEVHSFQDIADLISEKYECKQKYIDMPMSLHRSYQCFTKSDNSKLEHTLGKQKWITVEEFLKSSEGV